MALAKSAGGIVLHQHTDLGHCGRERDRGNDGRGSDGRGSDRGNDGRGNGCVQNPD